MNDPQVHRAWAIRLRVAYLGVPRYRLVKPWNSGNVVALYGTREEARQELKTRSLKVIWPEARVERVTVTIAPLATEHGGP